MSYCRNNGQDSEVYVIGTMLALECCGCNLYKYSYQTRKYSNMIAHLHGHRRHGDKVPARAFVRLKEEQREHQNKYRFTDKRKLTKNVRRTRNELLEIKLWKDMKYHRKEMAQTALEVFEDVYKRKPTSLEMAGLAETTNIKLDLQLMRL